MFLDDDGFVSIGGNPDHGYRKKIWNKSINTATKKAILRFKNYLMNPTIFLYTGWEQINFLGSVLLTWESLKIIITLNTTKTVAIKCFQ